MLLDLEEQRDVYYEPKPIPKPIPDSDPNANPQFTEEGSKVAIMSKEEERPA